MRQRIRAGDQRTHAYIGRPVVGRDMDTGAELLAWQEMEMWVNVEPFTGREWEGVAALKDSVDVRITVPRVHGWEPAPRWRMRLDDGAVYSVTAVMPNQNNALFELLAKFTTADVDGR
jgi:hypothetical protein